MRKAHEAIDISDLPEVARLAEEVRASHASRELRLGNEVIAKIVPATSLHALHHARGHGRKRSEADMAAFRSSAGGWADVDTERLKADIYESRRRSSRPPVEL